MNASTSTACIYFLFTTLITGIKYFTLGPAENQQMSSQLLFGLSLFLNLLTALSFYFLLTASRLSSTQIKLPTFIFNAFFFSYAMLFMVIFIYDSELGREMQTISSFSIFRTYILGVESLYPDINTGVGQKVKSNALNTLFEAIKRDLMHWILLGFSIIGSIGALLFFIAISWQNFKNSFTNIKSRNLKNFEQEILLWVSNDCNMKNRIQQKNITKIQHFAFIVSGICFLLQLIIFCTFIAIDGGIIAEAAPGHWNMLKSLTNYKLSEAKMQSHIQEFRQQNILPDDLYYIDQRQRVSYPFVIGDRSTFCQFNSCNDQVQKKMPETTIKPPNVYLIIIESFSPLQIIKNQTFDEKIVPTLNKLQQLGTTELTLSSLSLPTANGWYSILTGELPLRYGNAMTQQRKHSQDILSNQFKKLNYETFYTSPSPPEFDGKQNIINRFDRFQYFFPFPNTDFSPLPPPNSWVCDRITKQQFQAQILSAKKQQFGIWMTVDTHTPFKGFDLAEFYDNSIKNDYQRVINYADRQIGEFVEFVKGNDNNSLVVILGDHGPRERPVIAEFDKYDKDCAKDVFNDAYFTSSGIIAYLGDNEQLKQQFNQNKTFVRPNDTNSFLLNFQHSLHKLLQAPLLTSRVPSAVSFTSRILEFRNEQVNRMYINDYSKIKTGSSLSCMKTNQFDIQQQLKFVKLHNAVGAQNRYWPGEINCIGDKCQFGENTPSFERDFDVFFIGFIGLEFGVLAISFLIYFVRNLIKRKEKRKG